MPPVDPAQFAELEFPVGACAPCGREVLAYPRYDEAGAPTLCCVHCDTALAGTARATAGDALPDIGYGLLELQGCGNPECGGGQCGRSMMAEAAAAQNRAAGDGED